MGSDAFQPIQGMSDLADPEISVWQTIEQSARNIFHRYGYAEVRTPILERTQVFHRSLGEGTDVVQKEMYQFEDRGGRSLALRPEGTAGVIRFVAGRLQAMQNARLYYLGPMFRSERPQAGRRRQFHQVGAEAIGAPNPRTDAEMIAMQAHLLREVGLTQFRIRLNTRGMPEDRIRVESGLKAALAPHLPELCEDCRRRWEANVLRILDCKNPRCGDLVSTLPPVTSWMSEEARAYLAQVTSTLDRLGLGYVLDPLLVRGLDYYVHTVWEITHPALGAQDAVAGGGRYRITFDQKAVEGVGFAVGMERLILAAQQEAPDAFAGEAFLVWLIAMDEALIEETLELAQTLRFRGVPCVMDLAGRSVKAQMKAADRGGATHVILRGPEEAERGVYQLKVMATGDQQERTLPELITTLVDYHRAHLARD